MLVVGVEIHWATMLVQERASAKPSKSRSVAYVSSDFPSDPDLKSRSWSGSGSGECFGNGVLPKLVIIGFIFLSAVGLLFLRNRGDTAALLCLESRATEKETIPFPDVHQFKGIQFISDKSKYSIVKTEKWIVVAVRGPPTEEIRQLVKIRGWQVIAVGDSDTPADWNVKGAIFLSVDQQALLGYRIINHLPYHSYIRKTVGYLFAIQHGAKKIYDADERGIVTNGNLSTHFDIELIGEEARREPILQYSNNYRKNRTVVNPYIHFGQRSVWPRGLPLEDVGDVNPEDYYGEVYRGKQFIQQGIANGLPDVDSVFYYTRKSGIEAFDIKFDSHAPPVALPQGIMTPLNSFNTLIQSPAFWGLMLPISVSTMASDILRGYWAQRILWEIGGYVAIYPPTVQRYDRTQSYPFSEEKDLHVNVGRLVKFLISWRSSKPTLFEKILHLSHSMAEEGFWTAQDVMFTAAWLQDLLAVGYLQPRLMTLELDRQSSVHIHGDHKEFVPLKLPSVHLGVEEAHAMNFEIGNLIRWRKFYGNIVLIMHCSGSVNHTVVGWRMLYGRIFKSVVVVSEQTNPDLGVEYGEWWQVYKVLPKIFERYANADGFMFLRDDTILNYWNLLQADKTRLWITHKVSSSWATGNIDSNNTEWYFKNGGREIIKKVLNELPVHFQIKYRESMDEKSFVVCSSEIFYVPRQFVGDFVDLVSLVGDLSLHHEIAVPLFFLSMETPDKFDPDALSKTIYKRGEASNSLSYYSAEVHAVNPWKVSNESDFVRLLKAMSLGDPLLLEVL